MPTLRGKYVQATLCAAFFASGASALILENLWFREAGVFVGSSVRATSVVLGAFMAGLAAGSALAARFGHRAVRLVRLYGVLELAVAVTGVGVILLLPALGGAIAPVFRALTAHPVALDAVRLTSAFALMVVPTTAMGATLPILVAALHRSEPSFGRVLGRLYGWNTLGAVAGILGVELLLVPWVGIRGAACGALVLSGAAGGIALLVARALGDDAVAEAARGEPSRPAPAWHARRVLACAFGCGASLLALEVIWSRFLALYVLGTTLALSLVLAVVLAGIALGGLAASRWLHRHEDDAEAVVPWLAVGAGLVALGSYAAFPSDGFPGSSRWQDAVVDATRLALPTSLVSGALFAVLGSSARRALGADARATGTFVVWNTLGAMVGALAGGTVLLPALGVDGACFVACALYVGVAACAPRPAAQARRARHLASGAIVVLASCLALFPFGKMRRHVQDLLSRVTSDDAAIIAYREGLTGTISVVEHRWQNEPVSYQLVTDGFSMSSTAYHSRRYMKLFVYMPVALRPEPKQALLVCYGVGQTAKALVETASLEHLDVVDVSRDILELGRVEFPAPDASPLDDPRVAVHVEDGRFFLQTTSNLYDLITGEPPPPQVAGVVNLYTREYFELVRDHLTDGGLTSYWLPVHDLSVRETQAIARAFCDVFDDCSLWTGFGSEWMLVGSRGLAAGPSEALFTSQWRDPQVAPELRAIGLERPEQLGALFMADAATLRSWTAGVAALDDAHPARLGRGADRQDVERTATFARWMETAAARERFRASELIARLWPPALRDRTLPYFAAQELVNTIEGVDRLDATPHEVLAARVRALERLQTDTDLRMPVLWLFGYTARHEQIMDELVDRAPGDPELDLARAVRALADHHFAAAARGFAAIESQTDNLRLLRAYAAAMAGHTTVPEPP